MSMLGAAELIVLVIANLVLLVCAVADFVVTRRQKTRTTTADRRMSHADLLGYSAKLDHELWPDRHPDWWDHPSTCIGCWPARTRKAQR
jgi:hypothetical protein